MAWAKGLDIAFLDSLRGPAVVTFEPPILAKFHRYQSFYRSYLAEIYFSTYLQPVLPISPQPFHSSFSIFSLRMRTPAEAIPIDSAKMGSSVLSRSLASEWYGRNILLWVKRNGIVPGDDICVSRDCLRHAILQWKVINALR